MPSVLLDASWLEPLSDEALALRFGDATVQRGRRYAEMGCVGDDLSSGDHGRLVTASVQGGAPQPYQVLVIATPGQGGPITLRSRCTCPMRADCKHVVALIVRARHLLDEQEQHLPDPVALPWHHLLDNALRRANDEDEARLDTTDLALEVSYGVTRAPSRWQAGAPGGPQRLRVRPLARGASGRWIITGASWDDIVTGAARSAFTPAHREAIRRVHALRLANRYAYMQAPTHLDVGDLGPQVWPALEQATAAGVELVPAERDGPPVRLADAAEFGVQVEPDEAGGLRLRPGVTFEHTHRALSDVHLVGDPAHGLAVTSDDALVIAPLAAPLRPAEAALASGPAVVEVPADDVPRFTAVYYPLLRQAARVARDAQVDLPEPEPPRLALEAVFDEEHSVRLTWSFLYSVGDEHVTVPVVPERTAPAGGTTRRHLRAVGSAHEAGAESPSLAPSPARDAEAEQELIDALPTPDSPAGLTTMVGQRRALVPVVRYHGTDTIAVVQELLPALARMDRVRVTLVGEPLDYREALSEPVIEVGVSEADGPHDRTDWFDLGVHVRVDGELVPFQGLFTALARGQSHLLLHSGTYFSLDREPLHRLRELIEESRFLVDPDAPDTLTVRPEHAGLWEDLVAIGTVARESREWVARVGALLDRDLLPDTAPPDGLLATLRPYQLEGFRWLSFLWRSRLGGVLADDMGLGKTLQMLAAIVSAAESGDLAEGPVLVVAPTSVVGAWAEQAARFAPGLRVRTLAETSRRRRAPVAESLGDAQLVLTSYAVARLDAEEFQACRWSALVLDEAQFVKNHRSKTYHAVRRIAAPVRFAMSGTPLENSLMDLWSLLSITSPGLFPDPETFADVYKRPIEEGTDPAKLPRLLRHVRPLMLRRTKEDVANDLPPKQVQVVQVTLSPAHRRVYDTHLHRERQKVLGLIDDMRKHRIAIFRSLTLLRMLSLAPGLVDDASVGVRSSKIDVLMELLEDVVAGGHRALVFSQFTSFLAMVRTRLAEEGVGHVYLDGSTRDRAARVEAFRSGDDPVFLISLKAGGTGLTLTEADYVFVLDPWWNPAAEEQAIDRSHRIGQDKHVMVYRLVAENTIEDKVVALQDKKRALFAQVVGGGDPSGALSADDIRGLLEG